MTTTLWAFVFLVSAGVLAYNRASLKIWTLSFFLLVLLHDRFAHVPKWLLAVESLVFLAIVFIFTVPPLRRHLFSRHALTFYRRFMPSMSRTEHEALEAGTVGWEAELFGGMPDWQKFLATAADELSMAEHAFLDGPVETACRMINDWDITHKRADLPPELWQFLKDQGFFGLIIPKSYGGKEFSALAHSLILAKLASRSATVASTVSVPNSLGPGELLLHYGTEEQRNYYLPRLAKGEEIPCFALTAPEAGSDAAAIPDTGIVCWGEFGGKKVLGILLNWDKRYITLAPVATLLGLAFKLYDPDHLLGDQENIGITCALIPMHTPGIEVGRRHFPLNTPFQNGPVHGKDVFIPLEWIIGGAAKAGHGWQMLMECLAAGRAISLPSSAVGSAKLATWTTGAYAHIRKQFNVSIGHFEGIRAALTRIGTHTYCIDAALKITLAAIDRGEKPVVASAIMKYHATERARCVINDAMDIHGGKGICLGPRNYLGRFYQGAPISITVEGANILTRNLIIFGQGALRCHPYLLAEFKAAQDPDFERGFKNFDKAFFGHIGFIISNIIRAPLLGLTAGYWVKTPAKARSLQRYFQKFTRFSAAFALLADCAMLLVGSALKRKEMLSARLGDILSLLYLGSAVLKHHIDQDQPESDRALVDWICQDILFTLQQSFDEILRNFPQRLIAIILRGLIFPLGRRFTKPSDNLTQHVAELLLTPSSTRGRLTDGIYIPTDSAEIVHLLDQGLLKVMAAEPLEKRLHEALQKGKISGIHTNQQIESALAVGILNDHEAQIVREADTIRKAVIAVDDFAPSELAH